MSDKVSIFWFRRDLRLHDNHGLFEALGGEQPVLPIFIFDRNILDDLEDKDDARVTFIHERLSKMHGQLRQRKKALKVYFGEPESIWKEILSEFEVSAVYTNRDYEPYARKRDEKIEKLLADYDIPLNTYKDHVIFEQSEILTNVGEPYTVFTPYSKKWNSKVNQYAYQEFTCDELLGNCLTIDLELLSLKDIGFVESDLKVPDYDISKDLLKDYKQNRDKPYIDGTSRLSPHLRHGTISVREVCRQAKEYSSTFMNEIIWRDFYSQVLYHHPKVETQNFKSKYDAVKWRRSDKDFEAWCAGKTGFPIVDAGMRQLNKSGWMHNRVRMITASFLCKDLLVDWRRGEAYFAKKLLDYDLASNNGGWQWAAGTGTDAAPYFRIFNPTTQLEKYDPNREYVKKWVPEFGTDDYPEPMVDHKKARERALETYKSALN